MIAALVAGGRPESGAVAWLPALIVAGVIACRQRHWGDLSIAGAILYPFSLALYCAVSAFAAADLLRGGRLRWKDRTLSGWTPETK